MTDEIRLTPGAVERIPHRELMQFLNLHGLELVENMSGKVIRPAVQPKDYAEEAA